MNDAWFGVIGSSKGEAGLLERWFHLKENETTVRRELFAGLTTFMAMSGYVLFRRPAIWLYSRIWNWFGW